ncbi:hypothetical protein Vretimale_4732 [Volvox reticuliferus]|uniref:Uncharacterized protein n=1 Tax=Volvox reticuliferus TaxID=1737510 RepID=A0A8J4FFQ3_9CHLO|nr:hypothetical protein Vretifemale_3332 [Volvox reticuliferus]GIL99595.1 hypothetical protein Vretimale_4732 [Volvox reticuliferus]
MPFYDGWIPKWSSAYWRWTIAASVPIAWYLVSRRRRVDTTEDRTDFDGFLKAVEPVGSTGSQPKPGKMSCVIDEFYRDACIQGDTRNPVDFDSFLLSNRIVPKSQVEPRNTERLAELQTPGPAPDMKPVTILYGTEYGFSKEIAEKLCRQLQAAGNFWPVLEDMANYPQGYDFSKTQVALVACSTQGDGVPPTEARDFCEWLFAGKAGILGHIKFAVCALGDKSYTHFCRCGKLLDAAFEAAGAQRLIGRVDVNKEDWPVVDHWLAAVVEAVKDLSLQSFADLGLGTSPSAGAEKGPGPKKWSRSRPFSGTVLALDGLCVLKDADDKNTVRMEVDLGNSGITYLPGDALGLYPSNEMKAVEELIQVMGAAPSDQVPVPSWHYEDGDVARSNMTLAEALAKCYDIRSPKPELLKLLVSALDTAEHPGNGHGNGVGNYTTNGVISAARHQQLRCALSDAAAMDQYLAPRHVIDILEDAAPGKLSATQVLLCLRQLQPRLYSISSSPLEDPRRVQVTVAEVKYKSLDRTRIGVCSTMISERLQVGARVPVYVHKNPDFRLPSSASTPIIMVGPGTGLAPFRSFIMQRLIEHQPGEPLGRMLLYFGCRRRDQDYLYGKILEEWAADNKITLFTAFSREQKQKVYVQDRLAESAELVWELLQQGGHFYVCGDAGSMAGAVEQTLLRLISERLDGSRAAAEAYLQALSDSGRYQRDVWY